MWPKIYSVACYHLVPSMRFSLSVISFYTSLFILLIHHTSYFHSLFSITTRWLNYNEIDLFIQVFVWIRQTTESGMTFLFISVKNEKSYGSKVAYYRLIVSSMCIYDYFSLQNIKYSLFKSISLHLKFLKILQVTAITVKTPKIWEIYLHLRNFY